MLLASAIRNEKELKSIGKEEIKLLLFMDNVYIENSSKSTKKKKKYRASKWI